MRHGPWYVLADSLIPSGEGLVRNFSRVVASEVAPRRSADLLYCPDSSDIRLRFRRSHGFGISSVVLWRGYGGRLTRMATRRAGAALTSRRDVYHLPPDGYEFGSHLPLDRTRDERWSAMREVLAPRATTGLVLLTVGADHMRRQQICPAIERYAPSGAPIVSSARHWASSDRSYRSAPGAALPIVRGELRDSYGYTWTLQGRSVHAPPQASLCAGRIVFASRLRAWVATRRRFGDGAIAGR